MSSLESIIVNAQRLSQRLKNREADADRILAEAEEANNQLETMRQVSVGFILLFINKMLFSLNSLFIYRFVVVVFVLECCSSRMIWIC